jgi:hypothetical protein
MNCLFCCDSETDNKPSTGKDLICPLCAQLLLEADQDDLKRSYDRAIERGYDRKAKAIKSFLIKEEIIYEPKTEKFKRNMGRKRTLRTVRPTRNQLGAQQTTVVLD